MLSKAWKPPSTFVILTAQGQRREAVERDLQEINTVRMIGQWVD